MIMVAKECANFWHRSSHHRCFPRDSHSFSPGKRMRLPWCAEEFKRFAVEAGAAVGELGVGQLDPGQSLGCFLGIKIMTKDEYNKQFPDVDGRCRHVGGMLDSVRMTLKNKRTQNKSVLPCIEVCLTTLSKSNHPSIHPSIRKSNAAVSPMGLSWFIPTVSGFIYLLCLRYSPDGQPASRSPYYKIGGTRDMRHAGHAAALASLRHLTALSARGDDVDGRRAKLLYCRVN